MAFFLIMILGPSRVNADDPIMITEVEVLAESPSCGSDSGSEPYADFFLTSGEKEYDKDICETESVWISEYSEDGGYVPYEGTFTGDEQYMVYVSAVLHDGYEFSADLSAEDISWASEMENFTVIEITASRLVFTYSVTANHETDWDTYESVDATCIEKGYWKYRCTGCGEWLEGEEDIDPDGHEWSEWVTQKASTTLEEGLRVCQCELCGQEKEAVFPRLYSETYKPETSWMIPASVAWQADQTVFAAAEADVRPATAFVWVDQDLKLYDRDHVLLSEDIEDYVRKVSPTIITAFYIEDTAAGSALTEWLAKTGYEDCFVVSTPENREAVKEAADLLHVRGMLDYSALDSLSRKDITDMTAAVNGAHGKVVILSEKAATYENVRLLQSLCTTVWVKTSADWKNILTQYTNGVNGVVVDDYTAAIDALGFFRDDAPSLLRVPFTVGHKGDPSNYAENTLESLKGAYEEGADIVENDILLSADGQIFIRHDPDLRHFLDRNGEDGEELTLSQIQSYPFIWDGRNGIPLSNDVSSDNPVYGKLFGGKLFGEEEGYVYRTPSLREYLETMKGKDLVHCVEIKSANEEILDVYKALVDELDAWDQVYVITFSMSILDAMYEKYPEMSAGFLGVMMDFPENYPYSTPMEAAEAEGAEAGLERLMSGLDRWNATNNFAGIPLDMIQAGVQRGLTFWPWTYELPDDAGRFAEDYMNGIHGLTTNEPWMTSDHFEVIQAKDETVKNLDDVPKPEAVTKKRETSVLEDAELVVIEDLNDEGTEKLAIWRYKASMDIEGENYGSYYLYSNPFTVTIEKETEPVTILYECTEGNGSEWTKGSKENARFVFTRTPDNSAAFEHFTGISIYGAAVSAWGYDVRSGSVILELKPDLLETLSVGEHTLTMSFDDGSAEAVFTIKAANQKDGGKNIPDTGDHSNPVRWGYLLAGCVIAAAVLLIIRKKSSE
ncbi:MAG: hypothetical protein IKG46_13445 [Solobacterium sp.]|nr:hypothetical protein [Solobacterium sp.]